MRLVHAKQSLVKEKYATHGSRISKSHHLPGEQRALGPRRKEADAVCNAHPRLQKKSGVVMRRPGQTNAHRWKKPNRDGGIPTMPQTSLSLPCSYLCEH